LCIGREPSELKFGIVNNETIYNTTNRNGSLMYIDELNNVTFDKHFLDWSDAYKSTKEGKLWGYLDIGQNFTQATTNKFFFQPANGSNINLYLDSSNQQITYLIQARVAEAYQNFLIKFIESLKLPIDPSLLQSPIIMQEPIYGEKDPQFISFMAPGIANFIIFKLFFRHSKSEFN
jgi:hypothetical protein